MKKFLFVLGLVVAYLLISGKQNQKTVTPQVEAEDKTFAIQKSEVGENENQVSTEVIIEANDKVEQKKRIVIPILSQKSRQERLLVSQEHTASRNKRRILKAKPIENVENEKKEDYYNLPLIQDR